ncbi:glycoside hydrolase family 65 protein [Puniceicoccales bacterium CK1056]|uniref:Glycoside hydrolase family 65 protein n=1 Tax=Oceanipulchritudo coccoides TaxID=2706888 RepID=A0A6B2M239_9BACT|nr:glycosyl hydrolase family 65 protein [Oceanipulchritudo coccoides]NDV62793.1 glycoside hydrolase family 65 protein [Oceanipulchritudo coccoides]
MSDTTLVDTPTEAKGTIDPHWYAQGDSWLLEQDRWDPERNIYFETIFSLANGYMGYRGYREELDNHFPSIREGYLAGMFAKLPPVARKLVIHDYEWDSRQMVSLPEIFGALVMLNGELFNIADGKLLTYRQKLDMRSGVLERNIEWDTDTGYRTRLRFTRFLSAATPNLAVHKIDIEPVNWSGPAEIWWDYDIGQRTVFRCGDPARAHVDCSHFEILEADAEGDTVSGLVQTVGTGHKIGIASRLVGSPAASQVEGDSLLSQSVRERVKAGTKVSIVRYTAISTTRDAGVKDPSNSVTGILKTAAESGYESLLTAQKTVWESRWRKADIEIDGPARDQALVRFGIFSLLQVAPFHADNLSVPARCYAYNRYNGLYFWDGEIFLLPFYQSCQPEVARNMLKFRCGTIDGARRNAQLLGAKGAIFPWQGDADFGEEQAPWGLYEYLWHQNADIIYAFDQYARSTGDNRFIFDDGLEVLAETARFWASKFELDADGQYHLDGTVGPDEAEEHGPDNGYTCMMAQRSLEISSRWWAKAMEEAPELAREMAAKLELGVDEIAQWQTIASLVSMPELEECPGVPLQDAFLLKRKREDLSNMTVDEFWQRRGEVQVIKQADIVLAMYLLEDKFTREQIKCGYEFYEPRTLHVSSLSYNTHSIVAAIIGHDEEAYEYFHRAAGLDLDNLRNATKDGLHAAALGGVWQMALAGFMGMRIREDHLFFQPSLPKVWKQVRFPVEYRGWKLQVTADSGSLKIKVSGTGHEAAQLRVGTEMFALASDQTIEITL